MTKDELLKIFPELFIRPADEFLEIIGGKMIFVDYGVSEECENPDAFYICLKCGKCGRVFEDGIMVDEGGTEPKNWED